jgi:hypothetical protein
LDADDPAEISEFETDWEEDGGRREKVYREICSSYPVGRFSNAQVRQRRIERLLNKPQKQRLIDDLMRGFYSIFSKVGIEYRTCTRTRSSSSQGTAELAPASNVGSSSHTTKNKRKLDDCEETPGKDEGDHPPKRPKILQKPGDDTLTALKFACPFHQHNPRKYGVNLQLSDANYRSCAGLGWRAVARIK